MPEDRQDAAAAWIAARRLERAPEIGALDPALRPADAAAGYAVQGRVQARLTAAGRGRLIGWKVGSTTLAMQRLLGVPAPCAGAILEAGRLADGAAVAAADYRRPAVECEVAVVLGRGLDARGGAIDRAAVEAAVAALHPAIEIVDDRYGDWAAVGAPTMIADDFFHAGIVLGPALTAWRQLDLTAAAGTTTVDGTVQQRGRGADVLGHPFNSVVWLAGCLAAQGLRLEAGQVVMTGSLTLPHWIRAGETVSIAIEGLGAAAVRFA